MGWPERPSMPTSPPDAAAALPSLPRRGPSEGHDHPVAHPASELASRSASELQPGGPHVGEPAAYPPGDSAAAVADWRMVALLFLGVGAMAPPIAHTAPPTTP